MKFKAKLYFGEEKISEGIFDTGMMNLHGPKGRTSIDGFVIEYEMLDTKENRKIKDDFLKEYPTRESFFG